VRLVHGFQAVGRFEDFVAGVFENSANQLAAVALSSATKTFFMLFLAPTSEAES